MSNAAKEMTECNAQIKSDVARLKQDMIGVRIAIARIEGRMAASAGRSGIQIEFRKQFQRIVGFAIALVVMAYVAARYVH